MTDLQQTTEVDFDKLMAFVFRAVDEVGATLNAALVVMGDKLGLYRAMAAAGPTTPSRLADDTGTTEAYVREWLNAQAAGAIVDYDPASGRYTLPPEQAVALTDESSPAYLPGFFQIALGTVADSGRIVELARSGAGYGWHEHNHDVHEGCERFFRPSYNAHLVAEWLPALDGVVAKLERGGEGGRHRLRPRRVDDHHGAGLPAARRSSARTTTRTRSARRGRGPRRPASRTGSASRWPAPTASPVTATTWSRPSTPCTTWATRSARRAPYAGGSPRTAPG